MSLGHLLIGGKKKRVQKSKCDALLIISLESICDVLLLYL